VGRNERAGNGCVFHLVVWAVGGFFEVKAVSFGKWGFLWRSARVKVGEMGRERGRKGGACGERGWGGCGLQFDFKTSFRSGRGERRSGGMFLYS